MIYEIDNFSDSYTCDIPDLKVAAVMVCLLGNGQYGLTPIDEESDGVPIFILGGVEEVEEWFQEKFQQSFEEALYSVKAVDLVAAFDSVIIGSVGDREAYAMALELIDDAEKRQKWRDAWLDKRRSSMNNIGGRAASLANQFRKDLEEISACDKEAIA